MQAPTPSWREVKCLQHCDRHTNILCCTVPPVCPICRQDTASTSMRIPPYVLPSPFVTSSQAPCSVVLKPSLGDFVMNYTHTADMHIGLTDSKGRCFDFDEEGLHMGGSWQQCIAVTIGTPIDAREGAWTSSWDHRLSAFADPTVWTVQRYHDRYHSCFDFVLRFLRFAGLQSVFGERVLSDKRIFCDDFLQQRTRQASQYVNLYRRILKEGYVLDTVT